MGSRIYCSLVDYISNICNNNIVSIGGDHMGKKTISATIDDKLSKRLDDLCEETERKRSWLIERAIETCERLAAIAEALSGKPSAETEAALVAKSLAHVTQSA